MTDDQRLALQALSQDLTRIALGRYRNQPKMATRFTEEAKKRLMELPRIKFYDQILSSLNSPLERSAEDILMYSTLIRNRA
ncbi:hypothetical protein COW38_02565 [Candidatus Collierbacteria bacterium CG17_big_fil_post_rev_8_21_14_2_50_45_7]|uniref:Uncharacterized protein n=1 Tax=Candidatus Collierbacteria bacterium CG17_big_fil_post_rev_8_21_14_2_50_45_7 TaxID=1974536 RepID=A0A2M7FNW0_9BACT|nr:MAG: hypothetical protein COW38_02565 [Candidatus Collierbacteria bacterium CG17_big_fil_post_rev_8_21_14_2_50_45_7]